MVRSFSASGDGQGATCYWFRTDRGTVLLGAPPFLDNAALLRHELARDGVENLGAIVLLDSSPEASWTAASLASASTRVWTSRAVAARLAGSFPSERLNAIRKGLSLERLVTSPPAPTNTFSGSLTLGFEGFTLRLFEAIEGDPRSPVLASVAETGELFTSNVVPVKTHLSLDALDGGLIRSVLARLRAMRPRRVYPAYGPAAGPEALEQAEGYLKALDEGLRPLAARSELSRPEVRALKQRMIGRFKGWAIPERLDASIPLEHKRIRALNRE